MERISLPTRSISHVDISVFQMVAQATGHQILPRPAQGLFSNWRNLIEQLKLFLKWMLIERWRRPSMLSSMCQHVTRLQFDSCAKKDSLCGTVMIHDGLNLTCLDQCHGVRSHAAQAPPDVGAKELSYKSLNLAYSGQHPCFGPNWFIQFCLMWRWIRCA